MGGRSKNFTHIVKMAEYKQESASVRHPDTKKNILKSNSFGVMQTVFFAFTCKFGLCLHVEKVIICINKTNWHPRIPQK